MSKLRTTPSNLFTVGKGYALAMKYIEPAMVAGDKRVALPYSFLAAFSIELVLKAAILSQTGDEDELRDLGHDIEKAFDRAVQLGYRIPDPMIGLMVHKLGTYHRELTFRYLPDIEVVELLEPDFLMSTLSRFIDEIEEQFPVWNGAGADQ